LIELDQIAAQHGMSVREVSFSGAPEAFGGPGGSTETSDYNTLSASFKVFGSYSDIQDFMRDIERSSRLMDFTEFSLETITNESNTESSDTGAQGSSGLSIGSNKYNITLQTYWRNRNSS